MVLPAGVLLSTSLRRTLHRSVMLFSILPRVLTITNKH